MTSNDLLAQLGIYFHPGFLSPADCERVMSLIATRDTQPGAVYSKEEGGRVDEDHRKVGEVTGVADDIDWLTQRFEAILPRISRHFDLELDRVDKPTLLVYKPGDFFLPHQDNKSSGEAADAHGVELRKITAVLYLNAEGEGPTSGEYEGARLMLFGLTQFAGAENHGLPVRGETGMLVAFRSQERHGVTELIRGRRCCAVTWYC